MILVLLALAVLALAACARRPQPTPTPPLVAELTIPATTAASATPTTPVASATATSTPPAPTTTVPPVPTNTATVPPAPATVAPATATAPPSPVCVPRRDWPVYVVQRGDTLFRIAQRTGSSVAELSAANCLANPNVLPAGTNLFVPRLPLPTATPTPTATAPAPPWATFDSVTTGVRFGYPAHWSIQQAEPSPDISGPDGFVRLSLLSSPQDIDFMANQEAFNGLYGTNPTIESTMLSIGFPARILRPSTEGSGHRQAALITFLPAPVLVNDTPQNYLLLAADTVHFQPIVNTLRMPPKPLNVGVNLFNAAAEPLPGGGRRVTFTWDSFGATRGSITANTTDGELPAWPVLPRGQLTVELTTTSFPNPPMTLNVWNDVIGQQAQAVVSIYWPCADDYFFVPAPQRCPSGPALRTVGVYQPFERGFMIWLPSPGSAASILVFLDGGELRYLPDLWSEGLPESDPSLVPPPGLFQPVRGFGKVWREDPDLRARLGWATAPEQSYDLAYQSEARSTLPGVSYLTRPDAAVLQLMAVSWTVMP